MTISYTTHLICAPDLPEAAEVAVFHVKPGQAVSADSLLITLLAADQEWPVYAPDEGEVTSLMVEHGDFVNSNDLLLMMEIAEKPSADWLLEVEDDTSPAPSVANAVSAASVDMRGASSLSVTPEAARLAAKLGLDLNQLASNPLIDEDAVLEYARQQLSLLAKVRHLLL